MIVVSNASNLNEERFRKLQAAGMDQLSISLDFPDERHDEFRRIPGLFDKMSRTLPELARNSEKDDILLNVCITNWNYQDLPGLVKKAKDNGADAILLTEMKREYTGTTSFSGYGRSSSQKQHQLIMTGKFLRYRGGPAAPPPEATPAVAPASVPAPTAAPTSRPAPVDDDLDSPASF